MLRRGNSRVSPQGPRKEKKGRPGLERPKSREETPKEGSGTTQRHTALQQYVIATHKMQGSTSVPATFVEQECKSVTTDVRGRPKPARKGPTDGSPHIRF